MKHVLLIICFVLMTVSSCNQRDTVTGPMQGPLRTSDKNPGYFTDDSGKAVYLTGSHTWNNLVDMGSGSIEDKFDYDFYLGQYRRTSLSSQIKIEQDKDNSITAGFRTGIGIQYEPYNISCLLKFTSDFDQISYEGTYLWKKVDLVASSGINNLGIEIIFVLPDFKYNLRE